MNFFFVVEAYVLMFECKCRQAKTLQAGLLALLDRVEMAKMEYHKLEGENKFLQS